MKTKTTRYSNKLDLKLGQLVHVTHESLFVYEDNLKVLLLEPLGIEGIITGWQWKCLGERIDGYTDSSFEGYETIGPSFRTTNKIGVYLLRVHIKGPVFMAQREHILVK